MSPLLFDSIYIDNVFWELRGITGLRNRNLDFSPSPDTDLVCPWAFDHCGTQVLMFKMGIRLYHR